MSIKYPLPDYAASIWFSGTSLNITFPNDQTIVIQIERCGVETSPSGSPLPSQRGWMVILQLLKDRAAAARDENKIGQRGQPTQYEVEQALVLDRKYASILGAMTQAKAADAESIARARAELEELGL